LVVLLLFLLPVTSVDQPREVPSTVLLPVQEGDLWRVQIVWPNGSVHHFGKFASKVEAVSWIAAHRWLTAPAKRPSNKVRQDE
jgi:hypothetical protein